MEILVGSTRHDAVQKAAEWFGAAQNEKLIGDIVKWASDQEQVWGLSSVFVEVDVPEFSHLKAANIDLMVTFSDRVAVCEVKNYQTAKAARVSLRSSLAQCCDSFELVKHHLATRRILPEKSIRPLLFFPYLNSEEIEGLIAEQFSGSSLRHVVITGGHKCEPRQSSSNGHPLYLPLALSTRIGQLYDSDDVHYRRRASQELSRLIGNDSVSRFHNLQAALGYLRREATVHRSLRLPVGHVSGLRKRTLASAAKTFAAHGIIELLGPYGVGKTAVAKELLHSIAQVSPTQPSIATCKLESQTTADLCRQLLASFNIDVTALPTHALIPRLLAVDGIVWVESWSVDSAIQLKALIDDAVAAGGQRACRFIIESRIPLYRYEDRPASAKNDWPWPPFQRKIGTLERKAIQKILRATAQPARDSGTFSIEADDNPALILTRWQCGGRTPSQMVKVHSWADQIFRGLERSVLNFLALLLDGAPIGIRYESLMLVTLAVFAEHPSGSVRGALQTVLSYLADAKFVIDHFVSGFTFRHLGAGTGVRVVARMDPSLLAYAKSEMSVDETAELNRRIVRALNDVHLEWQHINISLAMRRGDLRPFMTSTFRNGMWGPAAISVWLATQPRLKPLTDEDAYLERHCRATELLLQKAEGGRMPVSFESLFGKPPRDFPLGRMLHSVVSRTAEFASSCDEWFRPSNSVFAEIGQNDASAEASCWHFDLLATSGALDRAKLPAFQGFFQTLLSCHSLSRDVELLLIRRYIRTIAWRGLASLSAYADDIDDRLRRYFSLLAADDNFWYVIDMENTYRRVRFAVRRDVDFELSRFETDGNPNRPEDLTRTERINSRRLSRGLKPFGLP